MLNWVKEPGRRMDIQAATDQANYTYEGYVVPIRGGFRLYYQAYDGTNVRILSAISPDGLNWVKEPGRRMDIQAATDQTNNAYYPCVIPIRGGYRMYYVGYDGTNARILSAISLDGLNWVKEPGRRLDIQAGDQSAHAYIPRVVPLLGGGFRMYYGGYDGTNARILSAISPDGLNWVKEPGRRMDIQAATDQSVFAYYAHVIPVYGGYRMLYSASDGTNFRVLSAISPDGLNWVKEPGRRVDVQAGDQSLRVHGAIVVPLRKGSRMYYSANDGTNIRILSAISLD